MRQRLGIAMALVGEPEFLILDEPMNGLDPAGIVEMRELIQKLNKEKGITFLISSHILPELSLVATKYGFISKGKLLKEISAEALNKECTPSIYFEAEDNDKLQSVLLSLGIGEVTREGAGVRVYTSVEFNEVLIKVSAECKIKVVNNASAGLEDYYLSLMGGERNA
jgi:ABC-2 type transport system ATP-binding protein